MQEQPKQESQRSEVIRKSLESLKKEITDEITRNEVFLPETKMRILEAIRVQPRDVVAATLDESVAYAGEGPNLQTRDFLMRRITELVGPLVASNKNAEESSAFRKFLQQTVVGIHA